ncbi:GNAT family N-acetyltransferase [Flavobacterium branchiophilum]|uniref:N-acetyltransferase n=2 Tax=Flavobacterium branchiophilum TaxID=55197 RepID=A0A2H3KJW7_9FLAO|nr:GNAT family N-acetyltransferase [Flavobacterium branchiophilum]PDS25203.1 N-acetyltransferase [Flavobacterium branchiophilum]CCB69700.1 Probable ribosomal-protein-amino-adic N-acetyltransferase [Flavobacterium branchiophilum FL-15]
MAIIETNRLILRPLALDDAPAMFEMDKNPKVHQYLWNKPVCHIQETLDTITYVRQQYVDYHIGRYAVVLKETMEFIGWAGLKWNSEEVQEQIHFYDIGYRLSEPNWGKGYATEASKAWMEYGFKTMKINIIKAAAQLENAASNQVLKKIGMQHTFPYTENNVVWNWYEKVNSFIE